jgi:tetratricopeptide (TPR) repeat protein
MAEENEPNSAKKRRVIHWNPDAGREQVRQRWTWKRILAWSVGGFVGLLFAAGIVIRVAKLVLGPDIFKPRAESSATGPSVADASSAFVSQAKAEQMHEMASKGLQEIKRIPADHPVQLQQLILMEKSMGEGVALLANHDFAKAFAMFESLKRDIDAFSYNVKIKGEAKQGYDKILLRIKDLELARSLAPGALEAAFEAAGLGRQLLNDGNFSGAKKVFDGGEVELKKAEQALNDYVRDNLLVGQRALAKGEKEEARKAFQAAMEKSPGNEVATQGLKRAENIDRVYALLKQGEKLEKEAQYAEAAESYKKAFTLDSFSAAAQEGQARAARLEKETKFATAKTAAETAAKAKDWNKAIAEYQAALKVYPQKTDVQAALKSAKENAHKDAVQKALGKGFAYEKSHQWKEARDAYHETLQLEPEQADAKEGYTRSGQIIRALLAYEKYIEAAEQLANKAEFQAAIKRFNEAMAAKPSYLVNSERVNQLHALLMAQSKPVDVTFQSDGRTWVSILPFRQPAIMQEPTVIKMLPGDYEIVGRRKGYRDVNMLLQVRNGTPPPTVTVICNVSADRS